MFVDEAYRLAIGNFAAEARDELVDCLTKPKFAQKLVVILAGYDKDIDQLLSQNPGLNSRFPESIIFPSLSPSMCLELLAKVLQAKAKKVPLDISIVTAPSPSFEQKMLELIGELCSLESWGNARDMKTLAKNIFGKIMSGATQPIANLVLVETLVLGSMEEMLEERSRRGRAAGLGRTGRAVPISSLPTKHLHQATSAVQSSSPSTKAPAQAPKTNTASNSPPRKDENQKPIPKDTKDKSATEDPDFLDPIFKVKRDPGVSDAIWEQLTCDKHADLAREQEYQELQVQKRKDEEWLREAAKAEQTAKSTDEKRQREQERIQAELERRSSEAILAEREKERQKERMAQQKLQELGSCPAGYRWVKETGGGYRCAGGSHWLSDVELGL